MVWLQKLLPVSCLSFNPDFLDESGSGKVAA